MGSENGEETWLGINKATPRKAQKEINWTRPRFFLKVGDKVKNFAFDAGQWGASEVLKTQVNPYSGTIFKIETQSPIAERVYSKASTSRKLVGVLAAESSESKSRVADSTSELESVEVTDWHPFWVVQGEDLDTRPSAKALDAGEDEGRSIQGRWVDSNDLRVGDVILTLDGGRSEVVSISERFVSDMPVYSLTVAEHPNYTVGTFGLLVHNKGWCDVTAELFDTTTREARERVARAWGQVTKTGKEILTGTHGHHMALKKKGGPTSFFAGTRKRFEQLGVPLAFGKTWVPGMDSVINISNADDLARAVTQVKNSALTAAEKTESLNLLKANLSIGPSKYVHSETAARHMYRELYPLYRKHQAKITVIETQLAAFKAANPSDDLGFFQLKHQLYTNDANRVILEEALDKMELIRTRIESGRLINGDSNAAWLRGNR